MTKFVSSKAKSFLLALLFSTACSEAVLKENFIPKDMTTEPSKASGTQLPPATGDEIDKLPVAIQPVAVDGAFLYMKCAQEVAPSATNFEALVGCRLEDSDGKRKPASSVYADFEFGWKTASAGNLRVALKNLQADAPYDTVFLFHSTGLSTLENEIKDVQIVFRKASSPEQISKALPEILIPASRVTDKTSFDFQAVRAELSAIVTTGEPTPPIP
ncbi:MAG: hypothetical protein H7318_17515 [Oligoflexus sp.]|nr:hypothetical protein [Oligoflexus sp.]